MSAGRPPVEDTGEPAVDRSLDVKGLNCPMPLLRAKIVLGEMSPGEHLLVEATDPYSVMDVQAFCEKTGHVLVRHDEHDGVFRFLLRRR